MIFLSKVFIEISVDGAVVERGKPHLVQDAAVQVFTTGRNRRSILEAEKRYNPSVMTTFNRRRRQSWHDVNEYHSVPYYQYTRPIHRGFHQSIQCQFDDELLKKSSRKLLSQIEETFQTSIMTQTDVEIKSTRHDQSTTIDQQFIRMFNLNLETNEILLSSIVNPYESVRTKDQVENDSTIHLNRHGTLCEDVSTSTGDDYPHWWTKLSTETILSDRISTEIYSTQVKQRLFSSSTTTNSQMIDEILPQRHSTLKLPSTRSSKQSDTGYNTFISTGTQNGENPLNHSRERLQSDCSSTTMIQQLFERYEKTLKDRQFDDILHRYRSKKNQDENSLRSARVKQQILLSLFLFV